MLADSYSHRALARWSGRTEVRETVSTVSRYVGLEMGNEPCEHGREVNRKTVQRFSPTLASPGLSLV